MNESISSERENLINDVPSEESYPGLLERIKAIMIDYLLILVLIFIISAIFSSLETVPDSVRIVCFLFVFLLYDPLFTALFSGTVGHMSMGLRVKREWDENKNVNFLLALLRFIVKVFLGWISLLTVTGNPRKRAIHDQIAGTVVVYAKKGNKRI